MVKTHIIAFLLIFCWSALARGDKEPLPQDIEQEIVRYRALLITDSRNARYLNILGFAYYRLNRFNEAVEAYLKSIACDPSQATTFNNLGAAHLHLKEYDKAEQAFREALHIDATAVKAAYNLAVVLYREERFYAAYLAYRQAQQIDAAYVKMRFNDSAARDEIKKTVMQMPDKEAARLALERLNAE